MAGLAELTHEISKELQIGPLEGQRKMCVMVLAMISAGHTIETIRTELQAADSDLAKTIRHIEAR